MIITFNRRAVLSSVRPAYGHSEAADTARRNIYCCVGMPTTSIKISSESVGIKADLIVHCYRRDFDAVNPTHIEIDGTKYKISATGTSINDLFIKLTVTRC